jgi:RecJ-like exonuclease
MIGRTDLIKEPCQSCHGTKKDPKRRTRGCPRCNGTGKRLVCPDCGGEWGKECKELCMDQTTCMMEKKHDQA